MSDALARPDLPPQPDAGTAARDVAAIIEGMVDTAGMHGGTDPRHLAARVGRAVIGYLEGLAPGICSVPA